MVLAFNMSHTLAKKSWMDQENTLSLGCSIKATTRGPQWYSNTIMQILIWLLNSTMWTLVLLFNKYFASVWIGILLVHSTFFYQSAWHWAFPQDVVIWTKQEAECNCGMWTFFFLSSFHKYLQLFPQLSWIFIDHIALAKQGDNALCSVHPPFGCLSVLGFAECSK